MPWQVKEQIGGQSKGQGKDWALGKPGFILTSSQAAAYPYPVPFPFHSFLLQRESSTAQQWISQILTKMQTNITSELFLFGQSNFIFTDLPFLASIWHINCTLQLLSYQKYLELILGKTAELKWKSVWAPRRGSEAVLSEMSCLSLTVPVLLEATAPACCQGE